MKLSLRLPRREVLIIAAAAVVAVIITLAILAGSSRGRDRQHGVSVSEAPASEPLAALRQALSLEDFIIPEAPKPAPLPPYYPFRPRMEKWTRELVQKFWVPPRQVAIDVLSATNDRSMEAFFKEVR